MNLLALLVALLTSFAPAGPSIGSAEGPVAVQETENDASSSGWLTVVIVHSGDPAPFVLQIEGGDAPESGLVTPATGRHVVFSEEMPLANYRVVLQGVGIAGAARADVAACAGGTTTVLFETTVTLTTFHLRSAGATCSA